jgi:hypothetical protein
MMSEQAGQPILILGMHRSGTSYLARLMQSLGVFIGDDLVGPEKGNPRGHFEARPMLEFHQRLIAARDPGERRAFDDGMLVQKPVDSSFSAGERSEAEALVAGMRRPGPWGWKEPRTCLFLEGWRGLLPDARTLVVYRHPLEVHQSLLRRDHWDLALFPDQAIRAYTIYNKALIGNAVEGFIFNANAGFSALEDLAGKLRLEFSLDGDEPLPEFHAGEFRTLSISQPLHKLFSLFFPEAAAVFDQLQQRSAIPFEWEARADDTRLEELTRTLEPLLADMPETARPAFVPLLDWWAGGGGDEGVFKHYEALSREIAEHVRKVKQWNDEAAVIYEDNKRLAADYERMGKDYAKQQEFLAKQAAMQDKLWGELKWTGDSWKEQKKFIGKLKEEKLRLEEEIATLRTRLEKGKDAEK